MNAVLKYMENEADNEKAKELHLVTHSSGNFAQAVRYTHNMNPCSIECRYADHSGSLSMQLAYTAHALTSPQKTIKATIIMSRLASPIKKAGVIGYGARIVDCEPHNRVEVCNDEIKRVSNRTAFS